MHKRVIVLAVCLVMIFSSYVFAASDNDGFWAEAVLNEWESEGLLSGDGSGDLRPNDSITRAEFIALINRWKGFNGSTNKIADYSDVSEKAWYYDDIVAALAAGYIEGFPDVTIRPNDPITREEAMVIVARLNDLADGPDVSILAKASDGADVSVWAQGLVAAVVAEGLISGFDGRLTPKANITRAETVVLLDRVRDDVRIFGFEGVYGPITGIRTVSEVIIAASGITLQNMVINDGLAVSAAAGEGSAAFNNVTVDGSIAVLGGADAITLFNSRATDINISKAGVRLVLNGDTVVRSIVSEGISGVVEVKDTAKLESLTIAAVDNMIIVGGTASVESVDTNAGGARIETSEDTSIGIVTMNASTTVIGSGSIAAANVKANGCVMEKSPGKLNVDEGISFSVGDRGAADAQSGGGFVNSGIGGGGGTGTGGGGASANPVFKSDNIADKKVSYGTSFENLALPSEVILVGSDNAEVIADIDWSAAKSVYDAAVPGVYTLSGILSNRRVLEGSVPSWATAKTTVDISVTVLDGKTYLIPKVAVKVPFDIIDAEAMLDALPLSVVAILSDGSNISVNIDWEYAGENAIPSQISPGAYEYVGTVSGLPPDTPAVPLHGAVEVLSEENSAIQVASVVFDIAAANIVIPDINPVQKTFSVVFADQYGEMRSADAFEPEAAVAWSITDSEGEPLTATVSANITVTDGVVTVAKDAPAGEYIVTATVIGSDPTICAEAIVYVVEQNPVVSSLVISGPKAVVLDTDHLTDMTYSVLVLDEHGVEISSDIAPVLTLKEEITGVSLASDTITISSLTEGFVPGSFVLTAVYNNETVGNDEDDIQADDFVVSFNYAAPLVAFVEIGGINGEDLVLPAIGENAAFKQFSAAVKDQYARPAEGEVVWELSYEYAGVTLADGLLTVTDAAEAGMTVSFFAKVGAIKSLIRTVDIIKGTPVFTSIEDQGEDAVILPGNTPSAGLSVMRDFNPLDQYGDVFDGLIDWSAEYKDSAPDIDASAVSINGNGTLSVTALAAPGVVVVSAVFDAETDIVKTVEVSIAKAEGAALVPSGIVFGATDGSDIAIPFGETPVCRVLSPSFVDQYGDSIENDTEITVSVFTNPVPAGVSFNAESHTFTVAKEAALKAANFPENQSGFVVEFKAEAALPDTVGSVISGTLNIKVVKDSTMADIAIKSEGDVDTLAVPTLEERSSSLRFNVVGTDAYGNEGSEAQGVEWSIADDTDEDGLSIDTEGVLVIDNTALAGTITIRAVAGNMEDDFNLELTRESSILTKVEIAGQDGTQPAATVPTTGDDHIFYYAALKDQYDSVFSGGVVKYEWSLAESIGGVSFITGDANPGVLDTNGVADFAEFDLTVTVTVDSGLPIKSDILHVMALNPFSVSGLKWTNIPPSLSADMCFFGVFDKLEGDALVAAKAAVEAKEVADGKALGDYALGFIPQFYDADTDEEVLPPWSILQETFIAVDQLALEEGEYYFEIKTAIVNKAGELVQILASSISSPPISVVDDGSGIEISVVLNAEDNHSVDLAFNGVSLTGRYVVNAFMMDKGFSGYSAVMTSSSQVIVPLYGVATQLRFALIKSIVINDDGSGKVEMAADDVMVANAPEYVGNVLLSSEETAADINWVTIFNENIYPNGMYMFLDIDVNAEGEVIEKAPSGLNPEADEWYIHTADTDDYQVTYGDYERDEKVLVWIKNPAADGFAALTINGSEYRFVQSAEGIITLVSPAQDVGINGEVSIEVVHALAPNGDINIPSVADITGSYTIESHDAVDLTEGQATFDGRHIILTSDLIAEIGEDLSTGGRTVVDFNFVMTVSGEPSSIFSGTVEVGFSKSVRKVIDLSEIDTYNLFAPFPSDWVVLFNSSLYPSGVEYEIILPFDDPISREAPGDNPDLETWYINEFADEDYTVKYIENQGDTRHTVLVTIFNTESAASFDILSAGGSFSFKAVGSIGNYIRLLDNPYVASPMYEPVGVEVNSFWGVDGERDTVELQGGEEITATVSVNGGTPIIVEDSITIDYGMFLIPTTIFNAYTSALENDESATFDFSITVLVDGSPYTGTCRVTVTHMEW